MTPSANEQLVRAHEAMFAARDAKGMALVGDTMTLRDAFAMEAMAPILQGSTVMREDAIPALYRDCAKWAYMVADAMIEERMKAR